MNSIVVELYELSDAMSFMEECLDNMPSSGDHQFAGNAYILGLFGRRIAEIAELLEKDPASASGPGNHGPTSRKGR